MGSAYDSNPSLSWNSTAGDRISDVAVSESSERSSNISQVMKAVEDAENTIKQQMQENQLLKDQLLRQTRILEKYKLESTSRRPSSNVMREGHAMRAHRAYISNIPAEGDEVERFRWMDHNSSMKPQGTPTVHQNGTLEFDIPALPTYTENQKYSESCKMNGYLKVYPGVQTGTDSGGVSQLSTPSSGSFSPTRHRKEGEYDPKYNSSGQGLIPVSENSSNNLWKQELAMEVREHEDKIAMLRKHLADYSVKEAQIQNEKHVLEKRIAYMRMAFDQQQQDLVDAASKALSYRQGIIEENIRLTYALQAAQQERSTFVSSLLPLLTECNFQPSVLDAQSIVSNLKVLFKHLQEKLILAEEKLKESQYQLAPLHTELLNNTYIPQSPPNSLGAAIANSNKSREIVPQTVYAHAQSPISSPSNTQKNLQWEALTNQNCHTGPSGFASKVPDQDGLERISLSISRNTATYNTLAQGTQTNPFAPRFSAELKDPNPLFKDLVRGNGIDDPESTGLQQRREATTHLAPGNSPYLSSGLDDPNSSYPYLPPVLEEPSSSFSEAAEDDALPAIEGLQISGEAFPGRELQASGYSINGTTSCNFEWVRYLEDGSVNYIEGAKQPNYLVTADDVDSYLAIEVHPLDDKKRKGELVKVFANEQRKITCDPEMQEQIEKTLSIGQMSFEVHLSANYLDIWEQAVLAIRRGGYSIKCNGPRGVVVTEKFLPTTSITIPCGNPTEFSIQCANGYEYLIRAKDSSWLRDTIVLTMRLFKKMAVEKRKGRKKGLFFKS